MRISIEEFFDWGVKHQHNLKTYLFYMFNASCGPSTKYNVLFLRGLRLGEGMDNKLQTIVRYISLCMEVYLHDELHLLC